MKPMDEWYQVSSDVENVVADLRDKESCYHAAEGARSSSSSPPTWAAWGSLKTTRLFAC